ncbi:TetR/AcrR family transcriptional regulator [Alsobacter sp. SYSU M60028]|uniref:TetR/AcrR family transcriptional regulator n=1 Tax=Alsobacter ponti TaxID=2962936 RepID=A0ABT1LH84_9HYPH|nr:TetR/AcrR family transcriptional regulator [Alsobacter ponti]
MKTASRSKSAAPPPPAPSGDGQDPAKRQQILDGARRVFLDRGFEGASMGEIARSARVSKGTLYVYFENKEQLFVAMMEQERRLHFKAEFVPDPGLETAETLRRFGRGLVLFLSQPKVLRAMRTAMAIAERMPEVGRGFYERGPASTIRRIAAWLDERVAAGELAIPDSTLAAAQFLDLCQSGVIRPALFGVELADSERQAVVDRVVDAAVAMFMRAYRRD